MDAIKHASKQWSLIKSKKMLYFFINSSEAMAKLKMIYMFLEDQ